MTFLSLYDSSSEVFEGYGITDISEIKYFTSLIYLDCSNNKLTSIDVSQNTALKILYCGNNQLTAIDVSKNNTLESLYCSYNQLTAIDVSKNNALTSLQISHNKITMLDLRNCLTSQEVNFCHLICDENHLEKIILNRQHNINEYYISQIRIEYGEDIIEYVD